MPLWALIAMLVAAALGGFLLAMTLERFKASETLAYRAMRWRVELAWRVMRAAANVETTHGALRAVDEAGQPEAFKQMVMARRTAILELKHAISEAKLLMPSSVISAMQDVVNTVGAFGQHEAQLESPIKRETVNQEMNALHRTVERARNVTETYLQQSVPRGWTEPVSVKSKETERPRRLTPVPTQ